MSPTKVAKLVKELSQLAADARQAAVRMKGGCEIAAECDVAPGPQQNDLRSLCGIATTIINAADNITATIPGLAKLLTDAPKPAAGVQTPPAK